MRDLARLPLHRAEDRAALLAGYAGGEPTAVRATAARVSPSRLPSAPSRQGSAARPAPGGAFVQVARRSPAHSAGGRGRRGARAGGVGRALRSAASARRAHGEAADAARRRRHPRPRGRRAAAPPAGDRGALPDAAPRALRASPSRSATSGVGLHGGSAPARGADRRDRGARRAPRAAAAPALGGRARAATPSWRASFTRAAATWCSRWRRTATWCATRRAGARRSPRSPSASTASPRTCRSVTPSTAASGGSGTSASTRSWSPPPRRSSPRAPAERRARDGAGFKIVGPGVIDFELYATCIALDWPENPVRFDAVTSLLYVDRRGAPENRQAGLDAVGKATLLRATIATSRHGDRESWITEVNWPLHEGPHSPAGRHVAVSEEAQASYLARYYLLMLGSGMVERVYWWQLVARGYGLADRGDRAALRRRPAWHALAFLARDARGCRALGPLPSHEPPLRVHAFERAGRRDTGWWRGRRSTSAVEWKPPVRAAPSVRSRRTRAAGAGRRARSPSTGSPVYAEMEDAATRYWSRQRR